MRAVVSLALAAATLGCSGLVVDGPRSETEAFEWAEVPRPPDARDVHFDGQTGIDHIVWIQLTLPDRAAADAFAGSFGCTPATVAAHEMPFAVPQAGLPDWVVTMAPADAVACSVDPRPGFSRSLRLDPLPDGTVRVQLVAASH